MRYHVLIEESDLLGRKINLEISITNFLHKDFSQNNLLWKQNIDLSLEKVKISLNASPEKQAVDSIPLTHHRVLAEH